MRSPVLGERIRLAPPVYQTTSFVDVLVDPGLEELLGVADVEVVTESALGLVHYYFLPH